MGVVCVSIAGVPISTVAGLRRPIGQARRARSSINAVLAPADTSEEVELGRSGLEVTSVGIGAWSWGDRSGYWGYGGDYGKSENESAYRACMANGLTFLDTAEVYGFGKSEEFIGEFLKTAGPEEAKPVIATKFAPLPWRFTAESVVEACKASLSRLQQDKIALYMIHWPGFFLNAFSNDAYVEGLARCKKAGLVEAVGVSNFNATRIRAAHKQLAGEGVVLAHNQVQYSLLYRTPERTGVLETCQELGVTLVAYSPLCQGLLTGKFSPSVKPKGPRAAVVTDSRLREIEPLLVLMREIGEIRGKTPAQVAINWCMCKGTLPIPGAKTAKQVEEIAGALGWRLAADEVAALDVCSAKMSTGTGAPFENW